MEQRRKVVPPVYLLLALLAMGALHRFLPLSRLIDPPYSYGGAILIALGVVIAMSSVGRFRRAGTPIVPFERSTALVTDGFYRFTRNPMYLGMILLQLGTASLLGTAGPFLVIPLFAWVIQSRFIAGEERFLEDIFGGEYLAYKRRVRRWI